MLICSVNILKPFLLTFPTTLKVILCSRFINSKKKSSSNIFIVTFSAASGKRPISRSPEIYFLSWFHLDSFRLKTILILYFVLFGWSVCASLSPLNKEWKKSCPGRLEEDFCAKILWIYPGLVMVFLYILCTWERYGDLEKINHYVRCCQTSMWVNNLYLSSKYIEW